MQVEVGKVRRFCILFSIVFAGEIIFSLPFHIARFFRPTLLDAMNLTNAQLGDIFALYGVMAMIAYFPGGLVADRFNGRKLMSFSLVATGLGGLYFMQLPSVTGLGWLFAYWGITTILLFWASMIKITRLWGGESTQGLAFGILDGGRGLVAAVVASVAVLLLSQFIGDQGTDVSLAQQQSGLISVISFYSAMTFLAAVLVWFAIPGVEGANVEGANAEGVRGNRNFTDSEVRFNVQEILNFLKQPIIWMLATIVMVAYCGFKGLDYFGLYAKQVLGLTDVESASLVATASYLRPVGAIAAGILADRLAATKVISSAFIILIVVYLVLSAISPTTNTTVIILEVNIFLTFLMVFAVRGIYFALIKESNLSSKVTGTAVGVISVVGFTPDIFFAPLIGRMLDAWPGQQGFIYTFMLLGGIAAIGFCFTLLLYRKIKTTLP